jgi:hypothetical protein
MATAREKLIAKLVREAHKGKRYFMTLHDGTRIYYVQTSNEIIPPPSSSFRDGPRVMIKAEAKKFDAPGSYPLLSLHPAVSDEADEKVSEQMREYWARVSQQPNTILGTPKKPNHRRLMR